MAEALPLRRAASNSNLNAADLFSIFVRSLTWETLFSRQSVRQLLQEKQS
jgi:hypothetical protein